MPINKVEMSLDEIIKAGKSNDKGKPGGKGNKAKQGIKRRQISKQQVKNRTPKGKAARNPIKAGRQMTKNNKATTVATKKLVQKLVKKALSQTNVVRNRSIVPARNAIRQKVRGGRIVKKTVVLNRLKINPKSKVIARRRVVPQFVSLRQRPIQYQQTYAVQQQQPVIRRMNTVPKIVRKPIMVRSQPRTIIVQQTQPAPMYRRINSFNRASQPSIRQQISQMRQGFVQTSPRVQMSRQRPIYQQQQQQVRVIRQNQQFVPARQQRFRQQRNNNFGNRKQRQNTYDPMYEPPNFLQRIPGQNSGRRF